MKPNYMVIGSAKCASTSLCTLLGQHPEVFMVETKEPNFFSNDEVYEKGYGWYESLYDAAGDRPLRGEGSQRYTFRRVYPETAARIHAYVPDAKLIYIVRHPIRKIEGNWLQMRAWPPGMDGEVFRSFDRSVREKREWITDSAHYLRELEVYRALFPDEQILVLFFDDFVADPASVMRRAFEFLGVDPTVEVDLEASHQNRSTEKELPGLTLSAVRALPFYRSLLKLVPLRLRDAVRGSLRKPVAGRPEWKPETRRWVIELLGDDTETFLERYGKPRDLWDLEA